MLISVFWCQLSWKCRFRLDSYLYLGQTPNHCSIFFPSYLTLPDPTFYKRLCAAMEKNETIVMIICNKEVLIKHRINWNTFLLQSINQFFYSAQYSQKNDSEVLTNNCSKITILVHNSGSSLVKHSTLITQQYQSVSVSNDVCHF